MVTSLIQQSVTGLRLHHVLSHRNRGGQKLLLIYGIKCVFERKWLRCTEISKKKQWKELFVESRKTFDRMVQKRKRQYLRETQIHFLDSCNNPNPNEFWKTIGKIGMGAERTKQIPMEILQSDGTPSSSLDNIIEK